jgi:cytochrome P450
MGLPERDHADIRRKVILAVSTDKSVKGRNPEHIAAFKELSDFLTAEVAARRKLPTDDLITDLAEAEIDGDRLSEREIVLTTATFVMAGVESLSSFMSMLVLNLHDYPDTRRRIVADPGLIAPAIEESLRFNTSAQRFKRVVMRETELHGQKLNIGDKVALAFGSGNRDWRKFRNPDVYDIERRPQGHLGFGAGKHFCLGSQTARLVIEVAMKRFLERVPEYYLTTRKLAWNSSSNFRSPVALPFATR